jgi:D-glycero-D-manno-heptose 1,7-bisphosphate phosphatase
MLRPALFLDRDGVVNADNGYVFRPKEFVWLDGIFDTVRLARQLGLATIIVTNQAGIARGLFTESEFLSLTHWMMRRFAEKHAAIDAVYFCPYHADGIGQYRIANHPDRKPNPGMIFRAARDHGIALDRSAMVGDQDSDVVAARNAGIAHMARMDAAAVPSAANKPDAIADHAAVQRWLRQLYATG